MTNTLKTVQLTEKEWQALSYFLGELGDTMGNAGCNDLPHALRKLFTPEEGKKLADEYAIFNNPKEPEGPNWPIMDLCLVALLQDKIRKQVFLEKS